MKKKSFSIIMSRIAQTAVYDVLTTNVISILPRVDTADLPPVQGSIAYDVTDDSIRYSDGTRWLRVYPLEGDVTIDSNGDTLISSIQGTLVGPFSSISAGDVMTWNGTTWVNSPVPSGGTPGGPAGGELSGIYPNPTLATTAVTPGSYGSSSQVGTFTVDSKGRLTAAGNVSISAPPSGVAGGDLTGTYPNPTLVNSGVSPGVYTTPNITVNSKGIITNISSGLLETFTDISSAQAATISDTVGIPVFGVTVPPGCYIVIQDAYAEYHYGDTAWIQPTTAFPQIVVQSTSRYLMSVLRGVLQGSSFYVQPFLEQGTVLQGESLMLNAFVYSPPGFLFDNCSGTTFLRLRFFYKIITI